MGTLHHQTLWEVIHNNDAVNVHPAERYMSAASGLFLVASGLRRGWPGGFRMLLGAEMLRRAVTGHSYAYQAMGFNTAPRPGSAGASLELGVPVRFALTIAKPRHEVYAFWRNASDLTKVTQHLLSVEPRENGVSRWTVQGPLDMELHWDAEIAGETENERIAWRSLPGSRVESAGSVHFADAPRGRGTEVRIQLQYSPPAGYLGAYAAKLLRRDARAMIEADCWRIKQHMECGEIATTEDQPKGPPAWESQQRRREEAAWQEPERVEAAV